jgi:SAM-dependent methyltransferase/uncharacterized protein YbaR (Trm112 family)
MEVQHAGAQKGEIEFRKKLYLQQVEGEKIFTDEFDASGIEEILLDRMRTTLNQMTVLQGKGVPLSPYVEIGAERCQRSLVLENDLGLHGAAVDISHEMLKSCSHYQQVFNKPKAPIRICCDANTLPFRTGSIRFVFCYETLHHFPEPAPIAKEIHRVLAPGGNFLFTEEPFKQLVHVNLYKGKKAYSERTLQRSGFRKIMDHFFAEHSYNEVEHGIIENENITLAAWKRALLPFQQQEVTLTAKRFVETDLYDPRSFFKRFAASLMGGNITGMCRKLTGEDHSVTSLYDALICPSCRGKGNEVVLERKDASFRCPACSAPYPVVDGVLFLFTREKLIELYPEVAATVK